MPLRRLPCLSLHAAHCTRALRARRLDTCAPRCSPWAARRDARSLRSDEDNAKYLEIKLLCGRRFHDLSPLSHSQVPPARARPPAPCARPCGYAHGQGGGCCEAKGFRVALLFGSGCAAAGRLARQTRRGLGAGGAARVAGEAASDRGALGVRLLLLMLQATGRRPKRSIPTGSTFSSTRSGIRTGDGRRCWP